MVMGQHEEPLLVALEQHEALLLMAVVQIGVQLLVCFQQAVYSEQEVTCFLFSEAF